jgi:hypothetical protein
MIGENERDTAQCQPFALFRDLLFRQPAFHHLLEHGNRDDDRNVRAAFRAKEILDVLLGDFAAVRAYFNSVLQSVTRIG